MTILAKDSFRIPSEHLKNEYSKVIIKVNFGARIWIPEIARKPNTTLTVRRFRGHTYIMTIGSGYEKVLALISIALNLYHTFAVFVKLSHKNQD